MVDAFVDAFGQKYPQESDLSSQVDGVSRTFVIPVAFNQSTIVIYYNGVRQRLGEEVSVINSTTVTLSFIPQQGTVLVAVYQPI